MMYIGSLMRGRKWFRAVRHKGSCKRNVSSAPADWPVVVCWPAMVYWLIMVSRGLSASHGLLANHGLSVTFCDMMWVKWWERRNWWSAWWPQALQTSTQWLTAGLCDCLQKWSRMAACPTETREVTQARGQHSQLQLVQCPTRYSAVCVLFFVMLCFFCILCLSASLWPCLSPYYICMSLSVCQSPSCLWWGTVDAEIMVSSVTKCHGFPLLIFE